MEFFVIYRPIGTSDEAATDEEQGEKILFSYPTNITLSSQLTRIMMLEGLIDFTTKFASEDITTTLMAGKTWCFAQPEPGLWMICGINASSIQTTTMVMDANHQSDNNNPDTSGATDGTGSSLHSTPDGTKAGLGNNNNHSKSVTVGISPSSSFSTLVESPNVKASRNNTTTAFDSPSATSSSATSTSTYTASSSGLCDALYKIYRIYITLYGPIQKYLEYGHINSTTDAAASVGDAASSGGFAKSLRLQSNSIWECWEC